MCGDFAKSACIVAGTVMVFVFAPLTLFAQLTATSSDPLSVTILGSEQCIDGIDNDLDGFTDFPDDIGCGSYVDDDETDPVTPQCSDGLDNDSDGYIDYPADTGCDNAADDNEYVYSPPGGGGGGGSSPDSTTVIFRGLTYPGAELSLLKDGQIVKTDTADDDSNFDIRLSDLSAGSYNFVIYATDPEELRSTTPAFNVSVEEGVTTSISGVYIPPTIRLDKAQVKKGNMLTVEGYAVSESNVSIYMNAAADPVASTTSNVDGSWVYLLDTDTIGYGDQTIRVQASDDDFTSMFSVALSFKVGLTDVFEEVTEACGSIADLNGDCRVNLIDFSISAFWYKKASPPVHVDINSDGIVDLKDFSIMAYHWTG